MTENKKGELTPQQLQRRKKMVVVPLLFLIFAAVIWLIYAPSSDEHQVKVGINSDVPMPKDKGIVNNKRDAYEQEAMALKEQQKMRSLQDFSEMLARGEESEQEYERQVEMAPVPVDYQGGQGGNSRGSGRFSGRSESGAKSGFNSSAQSYQDINRQLGSFYEEESTPKDESKSLMEARLAELEQKLEQKEQADKSLDEQMALMEHSYQLAAKYMPSTQGQQQVSPMSQQSKVASEHLSEQQSNQAITTISANNKPMAMPVRQVQHNVVSTLSAPMSDAEFVNRYSQPHNSGFNTAAGSEGLTEKNSIRACVYKTVTVQSGQEIGLRLLEAMQVGYYLIPANTIITGVAEIKGQRVNVVIRSLQSAGNIVPVELLVYDTDGNFGISVPISEEINALKEVGANMGTSLGTSISITNQSAGEQLTSELGKGVIQGTSKYISKKISVVKVTLKAGYNVMLFQKPN